MSGTITIKFFSRISIVFLVCGLSACSLFYTPGMSQLRELCEKDGGMPVYQEIKAKGYFNKWRKSCGCWDYITYEGFQFMEFEIKEPRASDQLPDKGLWRISKVSRDSGKCSSRYDKKLDMYRGSREFDTFLDTSCIHAEKIAEPKSRYAYGSSLSSWNVSDHYGSTIDRIESTLTDRNDGKVVVRKVNYLLNPFPESALAYGGTYSCSHVLDNPGFKVVIAPDE